MESPGFPGRFNAHFSDASIAYYEATQQNMLSQSRFVHLELHQAVVRHYGCSTIRDIVRLFADNERSLIAANHCQYLADPSGAARGPSDDAVTHRGTPGSVSP